MTDFRVLQTSGKVSFSDVEADSLFTYPSVFQPMPTLEQARTLKVLDTYSKVYTQAYQAYRSSKSALMFCRFFNVLRDMRGEAKQSSEGLNDPIELSAV